ncbi:MAG: anhydro-N-acetylmuramic acid kinase, partial [Ignavibacteriota bacterium]
MKSDLYIGIMTGTSMDAIDLVIARFDGFPEVISEYSSPLDPDLRKILMDLATKSQIGIDLFIRTHFVLAQQYAIAVGAALKNAGLAMKDIRAIGLHGQTIRHLPKPEKIAPSLSETGATFQLGSGAALAALSGIDVISDFRSGDVALGGEGAPLVPMFDYHFFRSDDRNRILL